MVNGTGKICRAMHEGIINTERGLRHKSRVEERFIGNSGWNGRAVWRRFTKH
jgi:hypothetical protein